MKHLFLSAALIASTHFLFGQLINVADFENIELQPDSFLNGMDGQTSFTSNGWEFPVEYSSEFGYWVSGTAISTMRDTNDGSFLNLYSAYSTDSFVNIYGVANLGTGPISIEINFIPEVSIQCVSIDITNTTYARESMKTGDAFAKKFGGASGGDPDYFFVRISNGTDSVDFYLADFRFEDNSLDYIIDDWTTVDISGLTMTQSTLTMELFSSDTGAFGINTPLFFAYDNLKTNTANAIAKTEMPTAKLWMNNGTLMSDFAGSGKLDIYDATGRLVSTFPNYRGQPVYLDKTSGVHVVTLQAQHSTTSHKIFFK